MSSTRPSTMARTASRSSESVPSSSMRRRRWTTPHSPFVTPTGGCGIDGLFTVNNASNVTVQNISFNGEQEGALAVGPVATDGHGPTLVGIAYLNPPGTVHHVDGPGIREGDAGFGDQRGIAIYASNAAPGNLF